MPSEFFFTAPVPRSGPAQGARVTRACEVVNFPCGRAGQQLVLLVVGGVAVVRSICTARRAGYRLPVTGPEETAPQRPEQREPAHSPACNR